MKPEYTATPKQSQWAVLGVSALVAISLWAGISGWFYSLERFGSEEEGVELLALLGTFYGGFVGTIVSAAALGVLVWTVRVQLRELTYTRQEFRYARIAQEEANRIRRLEISIQALESAPALLSVSIRPGDRFASKDSFVFEFEHALTLPAVYDALGRHIANPIRASIYGRDHTRNTQSGTVEYRFDIAKTAREVLVDSERRAFFLLVGRVRPFEIIVYRCVMMFGSTSELDKPPCMSNDMIPEVEINLLEHVKLREAESEYLGDIA